MVDIDALKAKVLDGGTLSEQEAYSLCETELSQRADLWEAAAEITRRFCKPEFDSCSIINARSGRCPEDCKWCAQSAHYKTSADVYGLVSREECLEAAEQNRIHGVRRFSLVTSGRALIGRELTRACDYYREMNGRGGIELCASMGLLGADELQSLYDAGVRRYHCNLETAPSHFATLCSTHTIEDKIRTIEAARKIGFEICSGGIIGMGETSRQRVEFALTLRRIAPESIPINILNPIPGTPLENSSPLSPEEVLDTVAFFRFIHPRTILRFAGGRISLPREMQIKAMKIGVNGAIVGDLLITIGSNVRQDKELAAEVGYSF